MTENECLYKRSIEELRDVGPRDTALVVHLIRALDDKRARVRLVVVDCLGKIGSGAGEALGKLKALRLDSDPKVREAVALAINAIEG